MKKNTDWDRVSKEPHEIAYVRKLARELLDFTEGKLLTVNKSKLKRLSKSYLNVTKGYTKWK